MSIIYQAAVNAQNSFANATKNVSKSLTRISTGQRITEASDDVSSMAVGLKFTSTVSALNSSMNNAAQAKSLLGVADGSLKAISDMLLRQQSLALRSASDYLDADSRKYLNTEFQGLTSEIDRLSGSTEFNGIKLIDGSLYAPSAVINTDTTIDTSSVNEKTITFGADITAGTDDYMVTINGRKFGYAANSIASDVSVPLGGSRDEFVKNLANAINSDPVTSGAFVASSTTTNTLTLKSTLSGGIANNSYVTVEVAGAGAITGDVTAGTTPSLFTSANKNGGDLTFSNVSVYGQATMKDNLLKNLNAQSFSTRNMTVAQPAANDTLVINGYAFKYVSALTGSKDEILIGAAAGDTTLNTLQALNSSTDSRVAVATYSLTSTANQIQAKLKTRGSDTTAQLNISQGTGATITIAATTAGTDAAGVDTKNIINNPSFVGKVGNFVADYNGSENSVSLEVTVGDYTYKAGSVNTNVGADTFVVLNSTVPGGGSFRLQLQANKGVVVNSDDQAATFAARINDAFSGLTFVQRREVTSFDAHGDIMLESTKLGSLNGAAVFLQNSSFENVKLEGIKFESPGSGQTDAKVTATINGQRYVSGSGIGSTLYKGSLLRLSNENDSNRYMEFRIGDSNLDVTNSTNAETVTNAYAKALRIGINDSVGLDFQVGANMTDLIKVQVPGVKTSDIYRDDQGNYQSLDISTTDGAKTSIEVLSNALNSAISSRATVGVLQSRFSYASDSINSSMQNQDAARGLLLDTDVPSESTALAQQTALANAAVSSLAQANGLFELVNQLIR